MLSDPIFKISSTGTGATAATTGTTSSSSTGSSLASLTGTGSSVMGKDQFLQLLVVQLQNQDPTQPMQNTEFVAQLAQFSALEQMQNVNSNLGTSILLNQSVNNSLATTLIGRDIEAHGNSFTFASGDQPQLSFNLSGDANATVNIVDSTGKTVATIKAGDLKSGMNSVTWDGKTQDGTPAAAGDYTFTVSATDAKGNAVTADTMVRGRVTGVKFDNGVTYLLVGSQTFSLSDVTQILEAGK